MLSILDLVGRTPASPWVEGDNIPWHDPPFSQRMLSEHLTQEHDRASRRTAIIEQQVGWLHRKVLGARAARVLDLACGPGLYTSRLAHLGHACVGIDYSPASIAYAQATATQTGLNCAYVHADIRQADYGAGYDMVMLIFGEFNVFAPHDAELILRRAHAALNPAGHLVLEPHTFQAVRQMGTRPPIWYTSTGGLFAAQPHLCLLENFWDESTQTATIRNYVVQAATGVVTRHVQTLQAYTEADYVRLVARCGFRQVQFWPGLGEPDADGELLAVTANLGEVAGLISRQRISNR